MPTFIVKISQKAMSTLRAEGTEYYEGDYSDELLLIEAIINYPVKEAGTIAHEDVRVLKVE